MELVCVSIFFVLVSFLWLGVAKQHQAVLRKLHLVTVYTDHVPILLIEVVSNILGGFFFYH